MWVQAVETAGLKRKTGFRLLDFYDHTTGLTAMERTTGFSTAVMAQMMARGQVLPGVHTPEKSFPSRTEMGSYIDIVSRSFDIIPGYDPFRTF
jgi:saccharopine dehydrogenase-like NADP-dependent oxidoreductase